MNKPSAPKHDWIAPKLVRLGKLTDVAQTESPGPQGNSTKS